MPGNNDWWNGYTNASPGIQALTQAPQLPTLNVGDIMGGLPQMPTADPTMWQQFSNWLDTSGVLGKKLADGTQLQGWGAPLMGAVGGLTNAYFGAQQLKLAKDTLANNKEQFKLNFDAQKKTLNSAMEDRQRARVAANPGAYQSVDTYMNQNRI